MIETSFLPSNDFIKCVKKYNGNYKVQHFTCWHQLMSMLFGQLSNRDSLSDLVMCLTTQRDKWYHLGMGQDTTQFDVKTDIPSFIHITDGSVHDVNFMDMIDYETGGYGEMEIFEAA